MGKHHLSGDFEGSITGWVAGGTGTVEKSADQAKFSSFSLKCTADGAQGVMHSYPITLDPGTYSLSGYVYVPTAFDGGLLVFGFAGFSDAVGTNFASLDLNLRDQWQRAEIPNVTIVTDTAGFLRTDSTPSGPSAGIEVFLDGVQLEDGATVTDFDPPIDGRLLDALMRPSGRTLMPALAHEGMAPVGRTTMQPVGRPEMRPLGRF